MSNKLIMESWRKFVNEDFDKTETLTEEQLEEIFGKAAWEKLVDVWAETDAENTEQFTKQGLAQLTTDNNGNPLSPEQIALNVKTALAAAAATRDPEAIEAAKDMAKVADEKEPGLNLDSDPAIKKAIAAAPDADGADVAGPSPEQLGLSRSMIVKIINDPTQKVGPVRAFRTRLMRYLRTQGLPKSANVNSPIIMAVLNVVRAAAMTANSSLGQGSPQDSTPAKLGGEPGSDSLTPNLEESIEKVFTPIIIEEIKREKTRRVLFEIAQMVAK